MSNDADEKRCKTLTMSVTDTDISRLAQVRTQNGFTIKEATAAVQVLRMGLTSIEGGTSQKKHRILKSVRSERWARRAAA